MLIRIIVDFTSSLVIDILSPQSGLALQVGVPTRPLGVWEVLGQLDAALREFGQSKIRLYFFTSSILRCLLVILNLTKNEGSLTYEGFSNILGSQDIMDMKYVP